MWWGLADSDPAVEVLQRCFVAVEALRGVVDGFSRIFIPRMFAVLASRGTVAELARCLAKLD